MDTRSADEDRDVEVFERIPWDSLKPPPDRRWLVYLVAVAVVLTAVGLSVGRGMAPPVGHAVVGSDVQVETTVVAPAQPVEPLDSPPSTSPVDVASAMWSEADLMAVPFHNLEGEAATLGEWFVVDWFTRDGTDESSEGRSFVEWAGVSGVEWVGDDTIDVTVLVRRLASLDGGPYSRLPDEAWLVTAVVDNGEWQIIEGPVLAALSGGSVDIAPLVDDVPQHLMGMVDGTPVAARRDRDGWLVELSWEDPAGLSWPIRQRVLSEES